MTHASLFSGIGGAELAAMWMGWENVFHCEINEFPRKVLEYWYPNSVSYEDITTTDFTSWRGKVDILTGGFPCQPFSMAGKRLGAEDDRYLWPHMLRAIREVQPTWVVGENVAGLVTMVQPSEEFEVGGQASLFNESYRTREEQPYTIEEICKSLEREGYSVQPFVIPACAVGAPHRRDRIWIVAHRTDAGLKICENGKSIPMNLTLLPTPTAKDGQGGANKLTNGKRCRLSGQVFSATLKDLAAGKLLPTPRAMDCKTGTPMESKKYNRDTDLKNFVAKRAGQTSQLNPLFVGEMMGFPLDWLTLPFQNGEQRALKP